MIDRLQDIEEDDLCDFLVDWKILSTFENLSDDFVRKYKDKVDWRFVCVYKDMSEDFIREFQAYVDWGNVCAFQKLSEGFIREFEPRLYHQCWLGLFVNHDTNLSDEFRAEFAHKLKQK